jgi:proline iminopeptidase
MKSLYPEIEPYAAGLMKRGGHQVYLEQSGNPQGLPVLFLHGGPGSGCKSYHRRFFDPEKYRAILLDQRGSGRSLPHGRLTQNTTADLLRDLEHIRRSLGIESWVLFGGSWGSTLGLLYAQKHPARTAGLVLRGSFLARRCDLDWFIGETGVRRIYPECWAQFIAGLPEAEQADPVTALYQRLTGEDELAQRRAARDWAHWSGQVALGDAFDPGASGEHVSANMVNQARIELHYAVNGYFLEDNPILEGCAKLGRLPAILIHGRRDLVCPVEASYALHARLPDSQLRVVPDAGHIAGGESMIDALVTAADDMAAWLGR